MTKNDVISCSVVSVGCCDENKIERRSLLQLIFIYCLVRYYKKNEICLLKYMLVGW